jgi:hypothetical protein
MVDVERFVSVINHQPSTINHRPSTLNPQPFPRSGRKQTVLAVNTLAMRSLVLWLLIVLPGVAAVAVSGYYLFRDWAALNVAYARFQQLAGGNADLRALFIADAVQNIHRLNCFAEGIGVLLGAILAAIGIHGLCTRRNPY